MRKDFTYLSSDGITQIHAVEWAPDGEVKAVVQLIHGMIEFIGRYERFAEFLSAQGYYVVGNDHLGHGESVRNMEELYAKQEAAGEERKPVRGEYHGYFGEPNGNALVIADLQQLRKITQEKYPNVPYLVLGHSMGSFLVQQFTELHGEGIDAMVVMGTGHQPKAVLKLAQRISRKVIAKEGAFAKSDLLDKLSIGTNNKKFEPARTPFDWLTKDTDIVDAYALNPWNTFRFSANAFLSMFRGMEYALDDINLRKIRPDMPIFIVSGEKDPVGACGKGPAKMLKKYKKTGHTDVQLKLYPDDRHEILNELDYMQVQEDLLQFFERVVEDNKAQ